MTKILTKRRSQRPFVNREISLENLKKDYEKYKIRLEKNRNIS